MLLAKIAEYHDALKILHIIAFTSWMAGLFYLPRLFVYHIENINESKITPIFSTMERRLYSYIMNPAMVTTIISGLLLAVNIGAFREPWFHVKLSMVILMVIFHFFLHILYKKFIMNTVAYSSRFFRLINEIPTLLLIIIVILVIKKPF